ncbi:hypothetical protein VTK73DRAFT_9952 [Phialemonium thermophilum]|uniref:Palmitoyltransferase n=1 Tax=Phialemonium thermophilum TaxID=223376 RepID=A0ABR3XJ05_9PEZI
MATPTSGSRAVSPVDEEQTFPQFPGREAAGPPSIISSRMTDIASEDGVENDAQQDSPEQRRSILASESLSRPGTARTGVSTKSPLSQTQSLRKGLSTQRQSIAGSTTTSTRPASSTGRSHVPSLTSHAFFHPMSSQRLQAQRGVSRPVTMSPPNVSTEDNGPDSGTNTARHSLVSNPVARIARQTSDEGEAPPPPSRGTEMTEQETVDRITANTSPTQGHYATASLSESVRPLQRKTAESKGLTVDVGKGYRGGVNLPPPIKSPRSFRSSFLLPTRNDASQTATNRDIQGGEKLDSVASTPRLSPADPARTGKLPKLDAKLGHNYEYFEGNTVFCIGGRLQNARHRPVNIATGLMVVIPAILFLVFSAPWLWHNISPAIPVTFAYLFYICLSSFLHASASDPGILPRNLHRFPPPDENEDPLRLGPPTNDWTLVKSANKSAAAMEVPTKYCKTCNIWRPPRAHHCRLCDNCVETQDHHCVWLNNCVGRRNYRYFFTFVSSATFLSLYLIGASLAQILVYRHRKHISFGHAINHFRVPFAMVIYGIFGLLYPAALMGYHLFLMARGETTREYLNSQKFLKKDRYRAFTQGNWAKNWFVVLCRPRPPTYYQFKKRYNMGDQRLGSRHDKKAAGDSKEGMEMQTVNPQLQQQHQEPQHGSFQGPVTLRNTSQPSVA